MSGRQRLRLVLYGAVQGVGFRPFVYRLATELKLTGWVLNSAQGVFIEVEGAKEQLEEFLRRLERDKPPRAFLQSLEASWLDPVGYPAFEIRHSEESGQKTAFILPDIATCPECLREIFDPTDRRYRYPFTNCTHCGPRFSIIEALPYDRPNTTMKKFPMCSDCQAEYQDPTHRRFHAQPNACPTCGPHLELWDSKGNVLAQHDNALRQTAEAIRTGQIVAVKGLGGFHLICDARNDDAVQELRRRKHREEKPFALLYPSLELVRAHCEVSALEERLLTSPEAPIVLLRRRKSVQIASSVAPHNPYLGIMLPYTPLHHLLMKELGFPVVATSGNLSDEPICTDEHEALERLNKIADLFLVHNRPIARHVDDSIVRIVGGRELVMRRARGFAPLPIRIKTEDSQSKTVLAVGAHLKNTIALAVGSNVFLSQHIGDLETAEAFGAFQRVIQDFERLYDAQPSVIAHDLHPDYLSTQYAQGRKPRTVGVQHHYAHVLACMAENELDSSVLGVSWDGTGYGLDGTIWGGEFLRATRESFTRVAHLRTFRLPGGERAIQEPRRSALGVLYELFGDALTDECADLAPIQSFSQNELKLLLAMLQKNLNSPVTSSAGRLFDAVASLVGLRQIGRFEGQAAMELEFALGSIETDETYEFDLLQELLDWEAMLRSLIGDVRAGVAVGKIAAKFHNTLVEMIVAVARRVGEERVVLTGGCFQNKYLTERAIARLREAGFRVYWHQRVPPNDGGIALGQIVKALIFRPSSGG
ncbi:MAG: carbamoyltransferase HypF [Candidatus Bipolaricaulota bacterium]|nr:carbamoyltransferase HypF [Candidatus Bipolaricaulota bacterium]MCS7273832.1 carbamoyltransferase HypF [Candidatus Bipolaricaulota bacterium]MDW8110750.1 carbamoyltransferase HypF [Candidatus Bipolaricaulota bacterium]MDW8328392.1 carbamoyltransferase HypF [Candidatus Bipolaricaulota bacterium]